MLLILLVQLGELNHRPPVPQNDDRDSTAPVLHQKQREQNATNAINPNENAAKSTKAIDILPLITVWLLVRGRLPSWQRVPYPHAAPRS
jgi:hypothetical protein